MRKTTTLLLGLLVATFAFGKSVTMEQASQVANKYLSATSLKATRSIANSFHKTYNGITTYYVFNYEGGGFVVVSADDAATPILAQSDEGYIEEEITNPEARYWFESYSKEIAHIVAANIDNTSSLAVWDNIRNNGIKAPLAEVGPLLTTNWDQSQYYNYYCPATTGGLSGYDGKVPVGCVATTMGQLMKYYNFPASGVGSYSYSHGTYGKQSADFGATNYNFANMGNSAISSSYQEIATLLYQAGVAVNMDYAADGSGAQSESVPLALNKYFNYDNTTIALEYMSDYTSADWEALLKAELDASRPLYYSGDDGTTGHAWVCDGYQSSGGGGVTMFHMNWGWSGSANAYYAIGSLNPGGYEPNLNNSVIIGIKPGNPNLIVRFPDLDENNSVPKGPTFNINCSVVKGTPTSVKLYIDDLVVFNTTQTTFSYPWNTSEVSLGVHQVRLEATDGANTVHWEISIGLSEWVPEASGFSTPSRGINYIHAVNANVVWATAIDGRSGSTAINEFTRTKNGGTTWAPGQVIGGKVYGLGNICGIDENTAFVSLYNKDAAQDNTCGVYKTSNGGSTWTHLVGALQGSASFADNVWFWDENNGMCHGDVTGTGTAAYFEIYTTTNGGATWTRVPKVKIGGGVAALSGEGGWTSVIEAVGTNTIMFGTNKGNLYISHDRGQNWTISSTGITPTASGGINKISFKDDMNGLVAQTSETLVLKETHDGGSTWQTISPTGSFHALDMVYVPGTENTWISVGNGASYSFDGGHSWAAFPGTQTEQFLAVDFANNHCGWAGTYNTSATVKGMYKYSGLLEMLNPVTNLSAQVVNNSVHLSWTEPVTPPLSYNIYRNNILLTNTTSMEYVDYPSVGGPVNYCVTVVYSNGESPKTCTFLRLVLGLTTNDQADYRVYPNPSNEIINVETPVQFSEVRMLNSLGKVVYKNNTNGTNLRILTNGFEPGMYILQIYTGAQVISRKVSVTH